jgi:hypothetical protein
VISSEALISGAISSTGLSDFGDSSFSEGLSRLCSSLASEAALTEMGALILGGRLQGLLENRLRIEQTYQKHPSIADEEVEGPIFIVGLPRTGTTALSQLVAMDPEIRSLRLWESSAPVPPPSSETQDSDPRIALAEEGLKMMDSAFPRMKSLYFQTATGPTECQDLLGMEFRTHHFDGMAYVPSYVSWVMECDMAPAYAYHHRTLRLLQWHCPPRLWHLKTPVHMLSMDALVGEYPGARFLWTHRDPAAVLGSVCSLIEYCRSWVSDQEPPGIGEQQAGVWEEALRRAMTFRDRCGEDRFADVRFDDLNADPVGTVRTAYEAIGLTLGSSAGQQMESWAAAHPRGAHGRHEYAIQDFGLSPAAVRSRFGFYLERFKL